MSEDTRFLAAFRGLVRLVLSRVDYYAAYECKVVSQRGDGTLDLQPDDPRIPAHTHVPIRYGIPGVTVKVEKDARVMLTWDSGDPSKPRAALWDPKGLKEVVLHAKTSVEIKGDSKVTIAAGLLKANGKAPVARVGDIAVGVCGAPGTPITVVIQSGNTKHLG